MVTQRHNPNYKLISKRVFFQGRFIEFVYGEKNSGGNEGLELYFYKSRKDVHFYRSYRYLENNIPSKYVEICKELKQFVNQVPDGHKLDL